MKIKLYSLSSFNIRLLLLLSVCLSIFFGCQFQSKNQKSTPEVGLKLSLQDSLAGGVLAKLDFTISSNWHIYGPASQKNGRPSSVIFKQAGLALAEPLWPPTKSFDEGKSGSSQGYAGMIEVVTPINPSITEVSALVSWVACSDICVPGEAELKLTF
jgi:DsbC/DsbD-like thiol-disulfide interchange protein